LVIVRDTLPGGSTGLEITQYLRQSAWKIFRDQPEAERRRRRAMQPGRGRRSKSSRDVPGAARAKLWRRVGIDDRASGCASNLLPKTVAQNERSGAVRRPNQSGLQQDRIEAVSSGTGSETTQTRWRSGQKTTFNGECCQVIGAAAARR
jgi:hypothetical protein